MKLAICSAVTWVPGVAVGVCSAAGVVVGSGVAGGAEGSDVEATASFWGVATAVGLGSASEAAGVDVGEGLGTGVSLGDGGGELGGVLHVSAAAGVPCREESTAEREADLFAWATMITTTAAINITAIIAMLAFRVLLEDSGDRSPGSWPSPGGGFFGNSGAISNRTVFRPTGCMPGAASSPFRERVRPLSPMLDLLLLIPPSKK